MRVRHHQIAAADDLMVVVVQDATDLQNGRVDVRRGETLHDRRLPGHELRVNELRAVRACHQLRLLRGAQLIGERERSHIDDLEVVPFEDPVHLLAISVTPPWRTISPRSSHNRAPRRLTV